MSTPNKILIVEDEVELAEIIGDYLIAEEYEVELIHTGLGVVEQVRRDPPDLILLDIMLPVADGLDICRQVRKFSNLPIIMMTAKVDEIDRLLGLDIGADDYICKPVRPKEVVARVRAVLRRTNWTLNPPQDTDRLQLDESQRLAQWDGQALELTPVEFRLLNLLVKGARVYTRSVLMSVIYEDGRYVDDRTIDSHIKNLRRKLVAVSKIKNPIRSVYGLGYKIELDDLNKESE